MEYPCGGGVSSQPSAVFSSVHRKAREPREDAVRAARKHLREIVRDDWTFEPSSSLSGASSPKLPSARSKEIQEWRERELDTSCSDTEGQGVGASDVRSPSAIVEDGSPGDESPDTVERRVLERRTKRRRLAEEEMSWNTGLRTYVERRDAWSGAQVMKREHPPASRKPSSKLSNEQAGDIPADGQSGKDSRASAEDVEMVDHESCMSSSLPMSATADTSITTAPDIQPDDSSFTPGTQQPEDATPTATKDDPEPLIPVVPPIIPLSNPIRASIDSSIYPSIYSKVVVQSLTPTIPINLADMTKCLVQGWKSDGQWPPQTTTAPDPLAGKRKPAVAQYTPVGGIIGASGTGATKTQPTEPPPTTARQKRGSGVGGTVRKVLGFPLHPFHLRRGSQATTEHGESHEIHNTK
ncbi:hypothetical protein FQN54_004148 [Arachnomyces sp. PD_36]|nr:hypothetical protein FQN54_004148 [Arachnomyces sp. PD_36]